MSIAEIVAALGGNMKVAQFLKIPTGNVRGWKNNGRIPKKHHAQMVALADKEGVQVTMDDLKHAGWTHETVSSP